MVSDYHFMSYLNNVIIMRVAFGEKSHKALDGRIMARNLPNSGIIGYVSGD